MSCKEEMIIETTVEGVSCECLIIDIFAQTGVMILGMAFHFGNEDHESSDDIKI